MWLSKYMLLQICCREKLQYLCNTKKLKRGVFAEFRQDFMQDFLMHLADLCLVTHTFCRICFFLIFFETRWLFLLLFSVTVFYGYYCSSLYGTLCTQLCVVLGNPCFNENHKVPCNTMHSVFFMFAPAMSQRGNKRGMARYLARCDALTIEV